MIAADVTAPNYLLGTYNITEYTSTLSQDSANLLQILANVETGVAQLVAELAGAYGQPYNLDSWDGYGAVQRAFMQILGQANNAIVLSGDTHNA